MALPRYKLTIAYDGTDFHGWQRQFVGPRVERGEREGRGEEASGSHVEDDGDHAALTLPLPEGDGAGGGAEGKRTEHGRAGRPAVAPGKEESRPELRTVQGVVETAVRQVVREPVCVFGASRTDTGVHARGQVAAFTTGRERGRGWPPERGTEPLLRAINSRLPDDVLVLSCEEVDVHFDPVKAVNKGYSYTWHISPTRPLWGRQYVQHVKVPVDVGAMNAAAELFVGEHDFAAFAAAGHGRLSTVRTVYSCSVRKIESEEAGKGAERVRLEISGSGFLWNMVRIIGGTVLEVGMGRRTLEGVRRALASGDRRDAGVTLPPMGLCLEWIEYGR